MSRNADSLRQHRSSDSDRSSGTELFARRRSFGKIILFLLSLFFFLLAILLMKEGASGLTPLLSEGLQRATPSHALGFGWLFAYLVLSGSPVAAAALTFLDAGAMDAYAALAMITGSRIGACFIVLLLGFIYVVRGRDRATSLDIGLLTFGVTTSTYVLSLYLGYALLQAGLISWTPYGTGALFASIVEAIFQPIINLATRWMPSWALFVTGLGIIVTSFTLFDRCLPDMTLRDSQVGQLSRLVYSPWIMFTIGGVVTLISMSVSVSLGLLVPLSQRGFVRRENAIPYIMGANVTTFIDTLLAAMVLTNPVCLNVVLASMISTAIVSIAILALAYRTYQRRILALNGWVTRSNLNLAIFIIIIFLVPILLIVR